MNAFCFYPNPFVKKINAFGKKKGARVSIAETGMKNRGRRMFLIQNRMKKIRNCYRNIQSQMKIRGRRMFLIQNRMKKIRNCYRNIQSRMKTEDVECF